VAEAREATEAEVNTDLEASTEAEVVRLDPEVNTEVTEVEVALRDHGAKMLKASPSSRKLARSREAEAEEEAEVSTEAEAASSEAEESVARIDQATSEVAKEAREDRDLQEEVTPTTSPPSPHHKPLPSRLPLRNEYSHQRYELDQLGDPAT